HRFPQPFSRSPPNLFRTAVREGGNPVSSLPSFPRKRRESGNPVSFLRKRHWAPAFPERDSDFLRSATRTVKDRMRGSDTNLGHKTKEADLSAFFCYQCAGSAFMSSASRKPGGLEMQGLLRAVDPYLSVLDSAGEFHGAVGQGCQRACCGKRQLDHADVV